MVATTSSSKSDPTRRYPDTNILTSLLFSGDPGGDLFTSPADPAFWVHHGQMDRLWTLWQTLDPTTRYIDLDNGTYGHTTWTNSPESALTTLDDVIDMGFAGPSTTIRELLSTTNGELCYFYE